ncbi:MAG: deoxyguanosinetriphosphate triphosphohydrolase [bacterium]|nr:deoxyguanosinetriphosphate triphosphohydrolase [bacterium]
MRTRLEYEEFEERHLAPYAQKSSQTRGRVHPEKEHPLRTVYQRDRDRIVHCRAFRRLEYKTQVFLNHEGDHYRTRLTHTMEVAGIGRTVARILGLNEDLTEAIALVHDVGHPPFGHTGESALNELMEKFGGFEHNLQSLRVVDVLEKKYPDFDGLNLSWEVREGIIKHRDRCWSPGLRLEGLGRFPSLEGQIIDCADQIAYNTHDIDDGLASNLLSDAHLSETELWRQVNLESRRSYPNSGSEVRIFHSVRNLIDFLVSDLATHSSKMIAEQGVQSADEARNSPVPLIGFSPEVANGMRELRDFLYANLYQHPIVEGRNAISRKIIEKLFRLYVVEPATFDESLSRRGTDLPIERIVCDHIAGMTDRYALEKYNEHFNLVAHRHGTFTQR